MVTAELEGLDSEYQSQTPPGHLGWAIELTQSFAEMLSIAAGLARLSLVTDPPDGTRLDGGARLNLYLALCALDQVLADHLHRHHYDLTRLPKTGGAARWPAEQLGRAFGAARRLGVRGVQSSLIKVELELAALLTRIAPPWEGAGAAEVEAVIRRLAETDFPRDLARTRFKVPSAFRTADVEPADCLTFARRASEILAGMADPVLVVGLRTSGLYMAPICVAELRRLGHSKADLLSLRPNVPLLQGERLAARRVAAQGGFALIIDDPTWTGSAYGAAAAQLTECGFGPDRLIFAVCRIENQVVFRKSAQERQRAWAGFDAARKIVLEPEDWEVRRRLRANEVEGTLNLPHMLAPLGAERVRVVEAHAFADNGNPPHLVNALNGSVDGGGGNAREARRHHVKAIYELEVWRGGDFERRFILAKGVGLGFFGYHSHLVASRLSDLVPTYIGLDRGIMFTDWVVGPPLREDPSSAHLAAIADYVAERSRRLALPPRPSSQYEGKALDPGSRRTARVFGRALGRAGSLVQFRLADEIEAVLALAPRAVIDAGGSGVGRELDPVEWIQPAGSPGRLLKTDFEEHCFDLRDRSITDPAFDLAAASSGLRLDVAREAALVQRYEASTEDSDAQDRMLFHKLLIGGIKLQAGSALRPDPAEGETAKLARARMLADYESFLSDAVNDFLARNLLDGISASGDGDIWGIDLDDVLESNKLGFRAASPAGIRAIRMLRAHGHVPVICSGRSLPEVRARCRMYGLVGGVAEYGSVLWDEQRQEEVPLVSALALEGIEKLRQAIASRGELYLDPRYQYCLRAYQDSSEGRSGAGAAEQLKVMVKRLGLDSLRVNEGWQKSLVLDREVNKGAGLLALVGRIGGSRLVRAVGEDSGPDLALLLAAEVRYATGNLDSGLRAMRGELGLKVARRDFQSGLEEIVHGVLHGTRGEGCEQCRHPVPSKPAVRLGLRLLGLQDLSRARKLAMLLHPTVLRAFEL